MNWKMLFEGITGYITIGVATAVLLLFTLSLLILLRKRWIIIKHCREAALPVNNAIKRPINRLLLSLPSSKSSDYAESYLNISSVSAVYGLNMRFFQSVPSMLTSLGILGTFMGLAYAVTVFDSSSSEAIRSSIHVLLPSMGTAFYTSIFGMFFSLVFLGIERSVYNSIANGIGNLCDRINRDHHQTSEQVLCMEIKKISEQISLLQDSIGEELGNIFEKRIVPIMNDLSEKLENPAQAVIDSLITEFKAVTNGFADLLTEKVNIKMEQLIDQFIFASDSIKEVPAAIDAAKENLLKSSQESIDSQKRFTAEVEQRMKELAKSMTDSIYQQVMAVQKHFDETVNAMRQIPEQVLNSVEAQKTISKQLSDQIVRFQEIESEYGDAIQYITDANKGLANANYMVAEVAKKVSTVAESIEMSSVGMAESNKLLSDNLERIKELNKEASDQMRIYIDRMGGIEKGLKGIFAEINKDLNEYADKTGEGMQKLLNEFTTAVTDATQEMSNSTAPLHDVASGILSALENTERSAGKLLNRIEKMSSTNKDNK